MKLITLEGITEFWNGFKENLSKVAFSGDYDDLRNKPTVNMGTAALAYGGTGAASAAAARTSLGLGAAATQDVADNLSTTSAGFTLDARQGKVLKDGQDAIDANLISEISSRRNADAAFRIRLITRLISTIRICPRDISVSGVLPEATTSFFGFGRPKNN